MSAEGFLVPPELRRGGRLDDQEIAEDYAAKIIELVARYAGVPDLGELSVLDFGCGYRFAQTLLRKSLPIGRYVGVDVYRELMEYLQANVQEPNFEFHALDLHNEMYNPAGELLSADLQLPVPEESFDMICLFSVFTHLAPHDYASMLKMLRRYVKPGGKLLYSLFVYETTPGGWGFIDKVSAGLDLKPEHFESWSGPPEFKDWDPEKPLKWAIYSREHALELIEGSGWEVESLNDPLQFIQHQMICTPV